MTERVPQACRVRARCDLHFRLNTDPDGQLITVENSTCSGASWLRNPPAAADTADITLKAEALPFDDPRVIADKSAFVSLWLYDESQREPLRVGGPGHFFGVVDDIRGGFYSQDVTLSCRDMTAVPLQAFLPEDLVKSFEIAPGQTVKSLVEDLVRLIPGTRRWSVDVLASPAYYREAAPMVRPAKKGKGKGKAAKGARLSDIIPPERISIWSAITSICARAGVVPEIGMSEAGPVVRLIDAADLWHSDVLRPFNRDGKLWRTFAVGDGLSDATWSLDLSGGNRRPDFLEVGTIDRNGRRVSSRWPPAPDKGDKEKKDHGEFQFVSGAKEDELQSLARAGFESMAGNQFGVELVCSEPWSVGGGPHEPDLLDVGYGALCEVQFVHSRQNVQRAITGQKLKPDLAAKIAAAEERLGKMNLAFQATEVKLDWGAKSPFRCSIGVRQFLGTESLPLFSSGGGA